MLACQSTEEEQLSSAKIRLPDVFHRWFEVMPADTPDLRERAYRLRYQVYCCEHEYETPEEHPQEMEMDAFDCRSIHSLLVDRASGTATGTVRLILPDKDAPESSFPIQNICNDPMLSKPLLSSTAEISRFAISKKIRKAMDGHIPLATDCLIDRRDVKCSIILGLMRATVQMSLAHGVTDWFAVMEPCLLRLLSRFGIHFMPIGPLVEHHGFRQPCHVNLAELLQRVRKENYDLWEFVAESGNWPATRPLGCSHLQPNSPGGCNLTAA